MSPSNKPKGPSPRRHYARRIPIGSSSKPKSSKNYVSRMRDGDRVYYILKDMRDKHRWGLKEFILALVTETSSLPGTHTPRTHTKKLSSAIYQQEEVTKQLARASRDMWDIPTALQVARLQAEHKPTVTDGVNKPNQEGTK